MPALNEQKNIGPAIESVLAAFCAYNIDGEIIVVDDGSSDTTARIVKRKMLEDGRIRLISHKFPFGIGASFWDGAAQALGQAVVMIPGDNENKPEEILRHLPRLDSVDMVIPYVSNTRDRPLSRRAFSWLYTEIVNAAFGLKLKYFNGTVLYKKEVLERIRPLSRGFFYQAEILIKAVKVGRLFAEVSYSIREKPAGMPRALSWKSFFDICGCYLGLIKDIYVFRR